MVISKSLIYYIKMDKLIRTIGNFFFWSADSTESRTIQGYAVVFDSESEDIIQNDNRE